MDIEVRQDGRVTILTLGGNLTIGEPEATLKKTVAQLIEDGNFDLLLDVARVEMVDSTGLGAIVRTLTTTQKEGGQTKLLNPAAHLKKLLEMTQLDSVFEVFADEEAAVRSF